MAPPAGPAGGPPGASHELAGPTMRDSEPDLICKGRNASISAASCGADAARPASGRAARIRTQRSIFA
eukprot:15431063-Alexandrium_andersonii.AAC.1